MPVGVVLSGSATRPLSIGVLVAGGDGAFGASAAAVGLLGVRGGPAIAAARGTVRGSPFAPRPVCAGVAVIVGAPQSSSSLFLGELGSSSLTGGSAGSPSGEDAVEGPLNDVPFGLHECVGLNIGVGDPVRVAL